MITQDAKNYFMGEFCEYKDAKAVIVPVPLEMSTSYLKGTVLGPAAIIDASYKVELYDIELAKEPYHHGISTLVPIPFLPAESIQTNLKKIQTIFSQKKLPLIDFQIFYLPKNIIQLNSKNQLDYDKLLEDLEDQEDVEEIFDNL